MESEMKRYRELASLSSYHHPNERIIMLKYRKHPHPSPTKVRSATPKISIRKPKHVRKQELAKILDDVACDQKATLLLYLDDGALSYNRANRDFEHAKSMLEDQQSAAVDGQTRDSHVSGDALILPPVVVVYPEIFPPQTVHSLMPTLSRKSKANQYKTLCKLKKDMLDNIFTGKAQDNDKIEQLDAIHVYLQSQLGLLDRASPSYACQRIQVFQRVFERVIDEFTSYRPILVAIKKEYENILFSTESDSEELLDLRSKVARLELENENSLMLAYERKRREALQLKLYQIEQSNAAMKVDYRRKLGIFASYLPTSMLLDNKTDTEEEEHTGVVKIVEEGQDTISLLEAKVLSLEAAVCFILLSLDQLNIKSDAFDSLKQIQDADYVPKVMQEQSKTALEDADLKMECLTATQFTLSNLLTEKTRLLDEIEQTLCTKQQQFDVLQSEYNAVSETLTTILSNST